jgi:alpha-glucan,water dikinase
MLDATLEDRMRMLAERQNLGDMKRDGLLDLMAGLLKDLQLSRKDESLDQGVEFFLRLHTGDYSKKDRWGSDWCKLMFAACDRLSIACSGLADSVATLLQGCCDQLKAQSEEPGAVFKPDAAVLATFGEETARCLTERLVAQILKVVQPQLRRGAGQGPWELVSAGDSSTLGTVEVMKALPGSLPAGKAPCIAVTETLTGWEDIPAGIVAVLLPAAHAVDVLSHVAIRARNQKVLLASCDDDTILDTLRAAAGTQLKLSIGATKDVTWRKATAEEAAEATKTTTAAKPKKLTVAKPPAPPSDVIPLSKFNANRKSMGGKSFNLSELKPAAGAYKVPPSATVPFGIFEQVLADPVNDGFAEELEELAKDEDFAEARAFVVEDLDVPEKLQAAIVKELDAVGAPLPKDAPWQAALKGVWASKWTDRAVSSRAQMGVPDEALKLAVLVQPVAFAAYAFVIHTRSPMANAHKEDALIELVVGLGESLVSNSPGRALSASVGPKDRPVEVHSYPSKPDGVFTPKEGTHIFRSDSNGEDLEGFAGAGLYDSITVAECPKRTVSYAAEKLVFDATFREELLRRLFDLGRLVETNFKGQPQDIEGAVDEKGGLVVLQSRPQV